jgi:hypothetical protein
VDKDAAQSGDFDLVVDATGSARTLSLRSVNVLNFHAL